MNNFEKEFQTETNEEDIPHHRPPTIISLNDNDSTCVVDKDNRSESNFSFLSDSSPFNSSLESFATTINNDGCGSLSRMDSDSAMSGQTHLVHLAPGDQIERDIATEEQLIRVRKEIEEHTAAAAAGKKGPLVTSSAEYNKKKSDLKRVKSRKDLIKVPLESGLPVALHPQETGKEEGGGGGGSDELLSDFDEEGGGGRMASSSPSQYEGMKIVDEDHRNYILMYDMLTGIRTAVSRCQAKTARPLTPNDYLATHKMAFDLTGSEETPSSRYDFKFKDYAPWVFRSLREQFSIDAADYLVSLTGKYVLSELYSPGKSGSLFYYSQDYRFIIKTIRESEHLFLRKILPYYHRHISDHSNSLLVRFYGLYRVQLPLGKKIYFVVMGNIFPNSLPMRSIYDLKGSTHGRLNPENSEPAPLSNIKNGPGPNVLKDLNWLRKREKLVLGPIKATQLMNQLKIDCKFLAKLKIMDYSLLIGLHTLCKEDESLLRDNNFDDSNEDIYTFYKDFKGFQSSFEDGSNGPEVYYLGIIDILTPYSMSKRLEHTFKSLVFPKDSISAVNPTDYARRFLKFMSSNILQNVGSDYSNRLLPQVPEVYEEAPKRRHHEDDEGEEDDDDDDDDADDFITVNTGKLE